jgi:riboflavin kinase/FMN adenylyltransferase
MRIIRDFDHLPPAFKGAHIALGNFDGVHLGHRAILSACIAGAKAQGAKAAVMTFEPHPREFFARNPEKLRIYPLARKLELLRDCGIDCVYVVRFNARFAATSAHDFIETLLHKKLAVRHVVTGYNFAFGNHRQGNTAFLAQMAESLGFGYSAVDPVHDAHGNSISSSAVRDALAQGDMQAASGMLGQPYTITGRVKKGDGRGRGLGFPTANLALSGLLWPRFGVYGVRVALDDQIIDGVANLGVKPTFPGAAPLLEVHCFGIDRDLVGKKIRVELRDFLREEQKFASLDALKTQIARDCEQAKERLSLNASKIGA